MSLRHVSDLLVEGSVDAAANTLQQWVSEELGACLVVRSCGGYWTAHIEDAGRPISGGVDGTLLSDAIGNIAVYLSEEYP